MSRARTRPTRQQTAERLVEGARKAFAERGFHGARVEDICAAAGLTRGAFYSGFESKEDLFFALYDRMTLEVDEILTAVVDTAATGEISTEAMIADLARKYTAGRDWYLINAEFTLYAIRNEAAARKLALRRQAMRRVITERLTRTLALGGRKLTIDADLLARALLGLSDAGLGQSLVEPERLSRTTFIESLFAPLIEAVTEATDADEISRS